MATLGSRPAGDGTGPDGPSGDASLVPDNPAGIAPDDSDGVEVDVDRSQDDDGSGVQWAGFGLLTVVLVAGAFAAGWHFGRRWGRLMGW